jgi:hypothetical protein
MLHETVELEDGTLIQSYTPCWDTEITHEELVHLKRIAQRARGALTRAKPGSAVWQVLRFILSIGPVIVEDQDETTDG